MQSRGLKQVYSIKYNASIKCIGILGKYEAKVAIGILIFIHLQVYDEEGNSNETTVKTLKARSGNEAMADYTGFLLANRLQHISNVQLSEQYFEKAKLLLLKKMKLFGNGRLSLYESELGYNHDYDCELLFLHYRYYKIIFSFQSDFQFDEAIGAIEIARVELYRKATEVDSHDPVVLRRHKIF